MMGFPDARDITGWLVIGAVDMAESAEIRGIAERNTIANNSSLPLAVRAAAKADAYLTFMNLVGDDKKFDVKKEMEAQLRSKTTKIGDQWYEYSTAGNIVYGFYGKAAGFSEYELRRGAGYAQEQDYKRDPKKGIGPCGAPHYCDTIDDYAAVGLGMFLYDKYYNKNGVLTENDLLDAIEKYADTTKMNIVEAPKDFVPRTSYYSANKFYRIR